MGAEGIEILWDLFWYSAFSGRASWAMQLWTRSQLRLKSRIWRLKRLPSRRTPPCFHSSRRRRLCGHTCHGRHLDAGRPVDRSTLGHCRDRHGVSSGGARGSGTLGIGSRTSRGCRGNPRLQFLLHRTRAHVSNQSRRRCGHGGRAAHRCTGDQPPCCGHPSAGADRGCSCRKKRNHCRLRWAAPLMQHRGTDRSDRL